MRRLPKRLEGVRQNAAVAAARTSWRSSRIRLASLGLGFDRGEHRPGICVLGVAMTDVDGSVVAISVPMPAARFYEAEAEVAEALLRTRDEVCAALRGR